MKIMYCITRSNWGDAQANVYGLIEDQITNNNQVIQVYEQIIERDLQIIHKAERVGDIKHSYADITHLRQLGYQPHYDITTGLKLYWESLTD